ncbi:MAG TPA: hypothetical protein VG963_23720 [Polyangiaceae bacterium]|nr:hypothetical protein [Polyangiaceae bacterium]
MHISRGSAAAPDMLGVNRKGAGGLPAELMDKRKLMREDDHLPCLSKHREASRNVPAALLVDAARWIVEYNGALVGERFHLGEEHRQRKSPLLP